MRKIVIICLLLAAVLAVTLATADSTSLARANVKGGSYVQKHRHGRSSNNILLRIKRGKVFSLYRRNRKFVVIFKGKKKCRVYKFGLRSSFGKRLRKLCRGLPTGISCNIRLKNKKLCVKFQLHGRTIRRKYPSGRITIVLKRGLKKKRCVKVYTKVKVVRKGKCFYTYRWDGHKWVQIRVKCNKECHRIQGLCGKNKFRKVVIKHTHGKLRCKIYLKNGKPVFRWCPFNKDNLKIFKKLCKKGVRRGLRKANRGIVTIHGRRYKRYHGTHYKCYGGQVYRFRNGKPYKRYTKKRYICYHRHIYLIL